MKNEIDEIYDLSVKLYYEISDDRMKARGHSGVMGWDSNENPNPNYGKLMGAIAALQEVSNKIKNEKNGMD